MVLAPCRNRRSLISHMIHIGIRRRYMKKIGLRCLPNRSSKKHQRKGSRIDGNGMLSGGIYGFKKQRVSKGEDVVSGDKKRFRSDEVLLRHCDSSKRLAATNNTTTTSLWSELPEVLLEAFMKNLTYIKDCIRFGSVCVAWKHVYCHTGLSHLPRQLPLLAILDHESHKVSLVGPSADESRKTCLYESKLYIPQNSHCIGSSEGWLVLIPTTEDYTTTISLLNPFLSVNNEVLMPPPLTEGTLTKVVLSANPSSTSDYVVAGLYNFGFAFYKPGFTDWIRKQCPNRFEDIIHFKDEFYVVNSHGDLNTFHLCGVKPIVRRVAESPHGYKLYANRKFLVELSGDLLLLVRKLDGENSTTAGCTVYKMDASNHVWNEVKSLGGYSLFLGGICSMSVLASHFRSGSINSNSIYFGYDMPSPFACDNALDSVVFKMEDGSFEQLPHSRCKRGPIWIEPKLQAH